MKIVRYLENDEPRAGVVDSSARLRSLAPLLSDWSVSHLEDDWMKLLAAVDIERLPIVEGRRELLAPVSDIRQILAIGLNYRDHAAEAGLDLPSAPMLFMKSIGSLAGADTEILCTQHGTALDWEIELGVVIRKAGRHIAPAESSDHVGGYLLAMDISERDWQLHQGGQFGKGKSYDSFTPVGPWLVTPDEISDPQALDMELSVNGVPRQKANTREMVFGVAEIISHLSRFQTLLPGDLILTGTPAGVGMGAKPQVYLKLGDQVVCEITGLGRQQHVVVRESSLASRDDADEQERLAQGFGEQE